MSNAVFLPWVRGGIAARLTARDEPGAALTNVAKLSVTLDLGGAEPAPQSLRPYGPGDVTGIDPRQIVRCEPPDGTTTFAPNHFAALELDAPELPWLFTPAAASARGRLRPWLVLVVVEDRPGVVIDERGADRAPVLRIAAPAVPAQELPDLADSWAWAHAQVLGEPATVDAALRGRPAATLARLLAPRRLLGGRRYHACLLPAFRAGCQAALGLPVDAPDAPLAPAWTGRESAVELPLYHHWRFATAAGGDFRSLARKLRPARLSPGAGTRPLSVPSLSGGAASTVAFEGALSVPRTARGPLPDPGWAEALRTRIDVDVDDDTLAPPRYGAWYVDEPVAPGETARRSARLPGPRWFGELNLDPRERAAAGLGARVVDRVREELVAEAFRQAADTGAAKALHERGRLAAAVGQSLVERHLAPLPPDRLLRVTAPAHAQLATPAATLAGALGDRGYPTGALSPGFRRFVRSGGPAGDPAPADLAAAVGLLARGAALVTRAPGLAMLAAGVANATPATVAAARPRPAWTPASPGTAVAVPGAGADSPAAQRFRTAARANLALLASLARPAPPPAPAARTADADLRLRVLDTLDARSATERRLASRIAPAQAAATLENAPPAARPRFGRAMITALNDLGPRLLLPGVAAIEPETVSVAEGNARFIEAFMVGLNHEANRVLLWRGLPVDRRAMPFAQFWRSGDGAAPELPAIDTWDPQSALGDHLTGGRHGLILILRGELFRRHPGTTVYARRAVWSSGRRVLAGATPGGSTDTPQDNAYPRVHARIGDDALLVGLFTDASGTVLDEPAARGADGPSGSAGWFFVLQEHAGEPRFGLAADVDPQTPRHGWPDLAWSDLPDPAAPYAGAHGAAPDTSWVTDTGGAQWGATAADMALITLRRPFRSALHARVLIDPRS